MKIHKMPDETSPSFEVNTNDKGTLVTLRKDNKDVPNWCPVGVHVDGWVLLQEHKSKKKNLTERGKVA